MSTLIKCIYVHDFIPFIRAYYTIAVFQVIDEILEYCYCFVIMYMRIEYRKYIEKSKLVLV